MYLKSAPSPLISSLPIMIRWALSEAQSAVEKGRKKSCLVLPIEKVHPILAKEVLQNRVDDQVNFFHPHPQSTVINCVVGDCCDKVKSSEKNRTKRHKICLTNCPSPIELRVLANVALYFT